MTTDNKTLADAQPGGRVRLGDQAERARFKAWWDAARPLEGSAFPYEIAWAAWQAALSAQPSPGGQGEKCDLHTSEGARRYVADFFARELRRHDFGRYITKTLAADFACALAQHLAARQPAEQPDSVALGEATEFCIEKGVRQSVGEPVAYGSSAGHQPIPASIYYPHNAACRELYDIPLYAALPAQQPAQVYLDGLDRALGEAIDQRDRYHEVADDLAGHIAAITGVDIGEHSSANCPWENAIEAAEEHKPAQGVDLGMVERAMLAHVGKHATRYVLDDLRALIDSKAVGNG